ncbi:Crp/Fnr family transcriptional regulator [Chryseobacterium sp.]|uniref:Crp/Fnr family transcriptional regulator n=1 Tax=Chryseobacterium sp. TaxID=1871047 RepID=UPI000ED1364C|nr:Crp/Fnr family transcriptional regulator [Chryseobacterium sp.]HCA06925.1 Crp/Fnr family transcriptional regulator [Chryseobacterium sp.]
MEAKELLREHFLKTISLTDEEFDYVFSHFKPISFKKNQAIISPGDEVDHEYFVINGCLKSYYLNDDLKMFILQFAMKTWWASDYNALFNQGKATTTVDCITDVDVLCLSSGDREKLCDELHQIERFFRWRSNKGYVAAHKRLLSLMNSDAKSRYEELMKLYPELYNMVPKHLIAAYLGVSRETLSRFR